MKMISRTVLAVVASVFMSGMGSAKDLTAEDLAKIAEAKEAIYSIAYDNITRIDNFPEVRRALDEQVRVLSAYGPDADKSLEEKIGAWQQLWTDDADDLRANNAFQTTDRERTYQVVFEDGVFYNLTEVKTLLGRFAGFLRGVYQKNEDVLALEFTKIRLKRGNLGEEADLVSLTQTFEAGELDGTFKLPGNDRYPSGPVGATGKIRTVYIDDDLRVDIGSNDADGVEDLFILRRIK